MVGIEIAVPLSDEELAALDEAVADGRFESRADGLRHGLHTILSNGGPSRSDIEESYRRAYEQKPEEPWTGEVGLQLVDDRVRAERGRS